MRLPTLSSLQSKYKSSLQAHKMNITQPQNHTNLTLKESDLLIYEHLDSIQLLADIGYLTSLLTLVFALLILTCIKRLRCPKNNLHLQLFMSFIIRCWFHWIMRLFVQGNPAVDPNVSSRTTSVAQGEMIDDG